MRLTSNNTWVTSNLGFDTALSETGPLVLLEYLSHGLPFITSDCGEVVKQIRKELPDFIASSFNEEEWGNKIELIEHEREIQGNQLNQMLKDLFTAKFSPKAYIEECQKILSKRPDLLIVSDTAVYINDKGEFLAFEPVLREIEFFFPSIHLHYLDRFPIPIQ